MPWMRYRQGLPKENYEVSFTNLETLNEMSILVLACPLLIDVLGASVASLLDSLYFTLHTYALYSIRTYKYKTLRF